jgi:hypothetical protein
MSQDTSIKSFAADCGTTVRQASVMVSGSCGPTKYSFSALRNWAFEISAAWKDRGIPKEMYLVARPDGTMTAPVLSTNHQNGYKAKGE